MPSCSPSPLALGPCAANSRWNRFAFDIRDTFKTLQVTTHPTSGKYILSVDGLVRTEASLFSQNCHEDHVYYCGLNSDTAVTNAVSFEACKAACEATKDCAHFTFHTHNRTKNVCRVCGTETSRRRLLYRAFSGNIPCSDAPAGNYTICSVNEQVGGIITLSKSIGDCKVTPALGHAKDPYEDKHSLFTTVNPAISFSSPPDITATQAFAGVKGDDVLTAILGSPKGTSKSARDTEKYPDRGSTDIFILKSPLPNCRARGNAGVAFMGLTSIDGELIYYKHDPRLHTIQNTLDSPADIQAGSRPVIAEDSTCPLVLPNFVNKEKCVRRRSGTCSPMQFKNGGAVSLNRDTLRAWYTESHLVVYAIKGLRLESPYDVSPCKADTPSRWIKEENTVCKNTVLDTKTAVTISAAIQGGVCAPFTLTPTDGKSMTDAKWKLAMDHPNADLAGTRRI